jgi:hypothetical protein
MTAVAIEGAQATRHRLRRRLRASVLGPRGGGTTRRRASDAFRLGIAVVVVAVSIPVMRANSAVELSVVRALHPPPAAISWLVTAVFWVGSAGVVTLLVIVGLLVPRFTGARSIAVAAVLAWGSCALLGATAGRPPVSDLAGLNAGYPVTGFAVTIAVAATALPYLSRPVHRLVSVLIFLAVLAAVCGGPALPVNAISSIALGWGVAAALHLAVGSPLGLPSAAEITEWITDLNVTVRDLTRLREAVARGAGIDVPTLAEVKRISWTNLLFAVGSLIGIWLIIGVLSGAGGALAAIKGASWGWLTLAFVFAQLSPVAEAWALLGAVAGQLPFGRCVALEVSNTFSSLVGGDVAVFAIRVRFFQRQGYDATAAVSSGAIASTASWVVKSVLFLVAFPFAAGSFHAPSGTWPSARSGRAGRTRTRPGRRRRPPAS